MLKISELTAKLAELPQMKEAKEVANELASDDKAKTWSNIITNITVRNNNEDGKPFFNITLKNKVLGLVLKGQDAIGNTIYGIDWTNYISVSITDVVLKAGDKYVDPATGNVSDKVAAAPCVRYAIASIGSIAETTSDKDI